MSDTSVPPCMPLVPFKLLPWYWDSEGVGLSKSICRFFKGNSLGLQKFLPLTQALLFFCSQKLWGFIFLGLTPWAGGPGVGLGLLAPKISLLNFYPPHVDVGPVCSTYLPLLLLRMDVFFFNSLVVRLPLNSISDWFWVMIFLIFSCNFNVVVQGGNLYFPMPSSWPELPLLLFLIPPSFQFWLLLMISWWLSGLLSCKLLQLH